MAPEAPYLANAVILYNYPGRSPQPVREAKPVPDRTLGAKGVSPAAPSTLAPKARQPSGIQLPKTYDSKTYDSKNSTDRRCFFVLQ